jgi:hypothetical protein
MGGWRRLHRSRLRRLVSGLRRRASLPGRRWRRLRRLLRCRWSAVWRAVCEIRRTRRMRGRRRRGALGRRVRTRFRCGLPWRGLSGGRRRGGGGLRRLLARMLRRRRTDPCRRQMSEVGRTRRMRWSRHGRGGLSAWLSGRWRRSLRRCYRRGRLRAGCRRQFLCRLWRAADTRRRSELREIRPGWRMRRVCRQSSGLGCCRVSGLRRRRAGAGRCHAPGGGRGS